MASSTQLTERVANVLGLPQATVALHMRNIREAGLITQGGRGRSAAKMTAADAGHLLIASVGSLSPKDSVEVVEKYAGRKTRRSHWEAGLVPKMDQLSRNHTFVEALTATIESAVADEISLKDKNETDFEAILFTLFWPWHGVRIQFYRFDLAKYKLAPEKPAQAYWLDYGAGFFLSPSMPPITPSVVSKADFQQQRQFTHRTIYALADLLKES
jgi:hypothetical protein